MKLRNLFFIGAFLVFALAMALKHLPYFQKSVSYLEIPLVAIEPAEVQTISIQKGTEELLLTKESGNWLSTNGQWSNNLDGDRVVALLNALRSVKSIGIVAQNEDAWPQFNQAPPEVHFVRLYNKKALMESFYLSATTRPDTSLGQSVFLRLPQTTLVYEVPVQVGSLWLQPFGLYRDRQLLVFDPQAVREIRIETPLGDSLRLIHADSIWIDSLGESWQDSQLRPWLQSISNLQGQSYAERFNEVEKQGLPTTRYTFSIENQGPVALEIYADSNQVDFPFVIRSNQFPGRYFKSDSTGLYQDLKFFNDGRFNSGL